MSISKQVEMPSGAIFEIGEFKVKHIDKLLTNGNADDVYNKIAKELVLEVIDYGPYPEEESKKLFTNNLLAGDKLAIFLVARILSNPDEPLNSSVKCKCGNTEVFEVLPKDIEFIPYPEESIEIYMNGNNHKLTIGKNVYHTHLATINEGSQYKYAKKEKKSRRMTLMLATMLDSIDNVDNIDKLDWLSELSIAEQTEIMNKLDEFEGGVETQFTTDCSNCDKELEVSIPFLEQIISLESKKKQKMKKVTKKIRFL